MASPSAMRKRPRGSRTRYRTLVLGVAIGQLLCATASAADVQALVDQAFKAVDRGDAESETARKRQAYQEAVRDAEEAVRREESSAQAHYALFCGLGRLTEMRGALGQMLALTRLRRELDRTLALNPQHSEALAAKGEMLLRLPRLLGGDAAEAERYLRQSLVYDPTFWRARVLLVQALREQSRRDAAAAEARDILDHIDPQRHERAETLQLLAEMGESPPATTPALGATP